MKIKITIISIIMIFSVLVMSGCMLPIFGNEPPIIQSSPSLNVKLGDTYSYQVDAIDDNDDDLTYSLILAPGGMTINSSTGLISWTPIEAQVGENDVKVKVSDGWHGITQDFTIEVSIVKLTSISVLPEAMSIIRINTQPIASVTAYYDNGSSESITKAECSYESSNSSIASVSTNGIVTGKIAGSATITVSYTENGVTKEDAISVTVTNPPSSGG
ncbi:MAG: hypothetical protein APR54_10310 [Candidatus Cloacimonas sp. SDB]|nr:MAG: hypothetical protein APR54_10310 [Candidatus Cloacimonas sp. SDB]